MENAPVAAFTLSCGTPPPRRCLGCPRKQRIPAWYSEANPLANEGGNGYVKSPVPARQVRNVSTQDPSRRWQSLTGLAATSYLRQLRS